MVKMLDKRPLKKFKKLIHSKVNTSEIVAKEILKLHKEFVEKDWSEIEKEVVPMFNYYQYSKKLSSIANYSKWISLFLFVCLPLLGINEFATSQQIQIVSGVVLFFFVMSWVAQMAFETREMHQLYVVKKIVLVIDLTEIVKNHKEETLCQKQQKQLS